MDAHITYTNFKNGTNKMELDTKTKNKISSLSFIMISVLFEMMNQFDCMKVK